MTRAGETRYGSVERDKPLKGKPWTWQRGETNPQRLVAEQAVEGVRNAEDGTKFGRGSRANGGRRWLTPR